MTRKDREDLTAWQTAWPEDSPLSEAELREALERARSTLVATHRRMKELFACLPMPADYDGDYELINDHPRSIYFELHTAVYYLMVLTDEECNDSILRNALEATPESLREEWARSGPRRPGLALGGY